MKFIVDFEGEMPGGKRIECGQYLPHDIPDAKKIASDMIEVLRDWTPEKLVYPTA